MFENHGKLLIYIYSLLVKAPISNNQYSRAKTQYNHNNNIVLCSESRAKQQVNG